MLAMQLDEFVAGFAEGLRLADAGRPVARNKRSGVPFGAGIGPHTESETVTLALDAVKFEEHARLRREVPYPADSRSRCDLVVGSDPSWAIEMKMLRLLGDNGKPNDNMLMHILSPYPAHRSAVTDCMKLLRSGFTHRKAIVIFAYHYDSWPADPAIAAFELLAERDVVLEAVAPALATDLVHPVHAQCIVFGWEIEPRGATQDIAR